MKVMAASLTRLGRTGRHVLTRFLGFLRNPSLTAADVAPSVTRPVLLAWLLILAFAVTAACAMLALPLVLTSEVTVGENLDHVLGQSSFSIIVALVILGPLVEEMIFRGWLTGTCQAMAGAALFLAFFYGSTAAIAGIEDAAVRAAAQIMVAAIALIAFLAIERLGKPRQPASYRRFFPLLFWAQGLVFGGLHFWNMGGSTPLLPVLMTIPLIFCGWLFAYARIVAGFTSAWLLHAAYNLPPAAAAIVLPLLAT